MATVEKYAISIYNSQKKPQLFSKDTQLQWMPIYSIYFLQYIGE